MAYAVSVWLFMEDHYIEGGIMMSKIALYDPIIAALFVLLSFLVSEAHCDQSVLDRYVGKWNVRVKTLQPASPDITYTETYEWVLDHKFLHGVTGPKPDGTRDVVYATYDVQAKGYPFWIFSSSGTYLYLPPATWNRRKHVMEWKNPDKLDINYRGVCDFSDKNLRRCAMVMKDWKGTVLLEQTWTATRIKR